MAGKKAPELFARNCAGVYLNAGTGEAKKAAGARLEYNVTLDKPAYEAVFDLPCPVYWMPCFETLVVSRTDAHLRDRRVSLDECRGRAIELPT